MVRRGVSAAGDASVLVNAAIGVTVAHGLLNVVTYATADTLDRLFLIVSASLFVVGSGVLALGLWNGIQRSRTEAITLVGLAGLDKNCVSARTRNLLWAMTCIQIALGVVFASLRPFTDQAFGILVPVFGLGITMLWASRFGTFPPRTD